MDYLELVRRFHQMCGLPIAEAPQLINQKQFAIRVGMIQEELSEYSKAVAACDIVEIGDAIGDSLYFLFGLALEHGIPIDKVFKQIHASNMTKRDGHKDAGGKWIKPDNYVPVDLSWLEKNITKNTNK